MTDPNKEVHIDTSDTTHGRGLVSNVKEGPPSISDENINMLMLGGNVSMMNVKDSKLTTDETLSTKGLPLLVAGLDLLPTTQPEEEVPTTQPEEEVQKEVQKNLFADASMEVDKMKELDMPEVNA